MRRYFFSTLNFAYFYHHKQSNMMKQRSKISVILLCLFFSFPLISVKGQIKNKEEEERIPEKTQTGYQYKDQIEYLSKKTNAIDLKNKYGNITVDAWDIDSVKIEYEININTFDEELAKELTEQITVEDNKAGKTLFIKTVFAEDFQSGVPFSINYHVHIPDKVNTKIKTGFGDTYVKDILSDISVTAEYGKLFITNQDSSNVYPSLVLTLSFIDGEISYANRAELNLNNCRFDIKRIGKVTGNTRFCVIMADTINNADLKTEIDRYTINYADSISVVGEKTFCTVNELNDSGHFEINEGGLNLKISDNLSTLTVANIKANTVLTVPSSLSYILHGEIKQGVLSHYSKNSLKIVRDMDTITFSGEFGENPKTNITLFNTSSGLTIKKQ